MDNDKAEKLYNKDVLDLLKKQFPKGPPQGFAKYALYQAGAGSGDVFMTEEEEKARKENLGKSKRELEADKAIEFVDNLLGNKND